MIDDIIPRKYRSLYLNNAWFKSGVDSARQLFEYTLDGLAADAQEKQRQMEILRDIAMNAPPLAWGKIKEQI